MSHDYAKSPLIEDIEEELEDIEPEVDVDPKANADKDNFSSFDPRTKELFEPHKFAPKDLLTLLKTIESDIHGCDDSLRDENEKRKKHRMDDCRRVHDYGNLFLLIPSKLIIFLLTTVCQSVCRFVGLFVRYINLPDFGGFLGLSKNFRDIL